MLPKYLLPQKQAQANGFGAEIEVCEYRGRLLVLTLGISSIIEREGIVVSVYGSSDRFDWDAKPLISFPQKYYCGLYSTLLNLSQHPDIRYLRAGWNIKSWATARVTPMCEFCVFAEISGSRLSAVAAGR
jgi:hypothetical protein